jgi:cell division protein FtsB
MESGKKAKSGISPHAFLIAFLVLAALLVGVFLKQRAQQRTLAELNEQRRELVEQVERLTREQERLQSDLEFAKSLEGLLQYARDNLGYLGPDDIRIDDGK